MQITFPGYQNFYTKHLRSHSLSSKARVLWNTNETDNDTSRSVFFPELLATKEK